VDETTVVDDGGGDDGGGDDVAETTVAETTVDGKDRR
jgi:hypothetical protein